MIFIKFLTYTAVLLGASFFPGVVTYSFFYQPLIISLILVAADLLMDELTLNKADVWVSTIMNFITIGTLLFTFIPALFSVKVTLIGAVFISFAISVFEYYMHGYEVRSNEEI